MNKSIKALIFFFMVVAGALFLYSIFQAGISSLNGKPELHSFLENAVIVIGGILSTNLGAVLGITLSPPTNPVQNQRIVTHQATFLALRSSVNSDQPDTAEDPNNVQKAQIIACWVYVIGLLAAAIFWVIAISKDITNVVNLLPELSKTLLGVIAGMITVGLGRK